MLRLPFLQVRVFGASYALAGLIGLVEMLARIGQALLLKTMVAAVGDPTATNTTIYLCAAGISFFGIVVAFTHQHFFYMVRGTRSPREAASAPSDVSARSGGGGSRFTAASAFASASSQRRTRRR